MGNIIDSGKGTGKPKWKNENGLYSHRSDGHVVKEDWDAHSSQEQIIGVKKTIEIEVTRTNNERGNIRTNADQELFRVGK